MAAILFAVVLTNIPTVQAQNAGCTVDRNVINEAVQRGEIRSFVQIKKSINLKLGDRVLRAALCDGPLYKLTIVDSNGVEKRLQVDAVTGRIIR